MATIYETKDGQQFKYEGDAQTHANNLAEREAALDASGNALLDAQDKVLQGIVAFTNQAMEFYYEGDSCWNAENWRGAVNAFTKAIKYIESPEWEANKQRFQTYCDRSFNVNSAIASMEKFYHSWKSKLADFYFERGMAKMKIGNDPTANRDFRINETLKGEILEAEKQKPYLKK